MRHTLRAQELPPHTGIYLVDVDGSRSHIGETLRLNGEPAIMRISDGEISRVLTIDDERTVELDTFGGPFPSLADDPIGRDDGPDPDAADMAADAYERGLDAICDRRWR